MRPVVEMLDTEKQKTVLVQTMLQVYPPQAKMTWKIPTASGRSP